jgi:hypothetical protein
MVAGDRAVCEAAGRGVMAGEPDYARRCIVFTAGAGLAFRYGEHTGQA